MREQADDAAAIGESSVQWQHDRLEMWGDSVIRYVVLSALLLAPSVAWAGKEMRAVTPSGLPDMKFKGISAADASGKLANSCMDNGLTVTANSPSEVICQAPMNAAKSALAQLLIGNSHSTTPSQFIKFSLAAIGGDVRVQASAWIETQMAFGQTRRQPLANDDAHNTLMAFMEGAEAVFLPGTSFPNYIYLGIGPYDEQIIKFKGRDVAGARISSLEEGTTLKIAGAQMGDVLVAINGKTFNNYDQFLKRLLGITVGQQVTFDLIRGGQPITISGAAGYRPTISAQ